jgi:serine protease Do
MSTRLIIQHQIGSKANQIEQFPLDTINEMTIGRDPASTIVFDAQRDDAVSRRHAVIRVTHGDRPSFAIADLGSANGTLVNGSRINSETELLPGDTVQFGLAGPSFVFDVQPRPPHLVARTRVGAGAPGGTTRIVEPAAAAPVASTTVVQPQSFAPVKAGVGRETVQRMLSEERQATGRKWMYALVGVLVLIGGVGGVLYYRMTLDKQQTVARIEEKARQTEAAGAAALEQQKTAFAADATKKASELKQQLGMSPSEVVQKYGDATVYIEMQWRLYDRDSSKALYHKTVAWPVDHPTKNLPAYVQLTNHRIVRWLTTEDQGHRNRVIGAAGSGSGFVINEQGYILTNKHVAAGWMINYNQYSAFEQGMGILFQQQTGHQNSAPKGAPFDATDERAEFRKAIGWTPDEGGMIFDRDQPFSVSGSTCACEGRDERLEVRFPGSRNSIAARLVRASKDADVALIKIDSPDPLAFIPMAQNDDLPVGSAITVLGYPQSSVKTFASKTTIENGDVHSQVEFVPEPTVTPGIVSRLGVAMERQGDVTVIGAEGEVYQLTAATSEGNSGGPVIDANGKAVGLFASGRPGYGAVTFAVPMHYGRDLMPVQRKITEQ